MRRLMAFSLAAVGSAILSLSAQSGQAPQEPATTFRAGVDVVQLDISVLDKNRHPVKGLTAADFTVLEDGKPQSIVAFAPVDIPGPVIPPVAWMRDVPSDVVTNDLTVRRIVVIMIDDADMPFDPGISKFAKQIGRAVVDQLGPNDLAAVTFTFKGQQENVTSDRRHLLAAIDSLVPHPSGPTLAAHHTAESGSASVVTWSGPPPCSYRGDYGCVVEALVHAANALLAAPQGRKTLVFISTGPPFNPSMANLESADEIHGIGVLFSALHRANVTVYAVDPSGLTVADGIIAQRLDNLRMFSEDTGGRAILATNTPWDDVPQIFQENSSYYLLGFQSTNPKSDGHFRNIKVKVNRPDLEVRTRSGYYARRPEKPAKSTKPPTVVSPIDKALSAGMPTGDLPIDVAVAPFAVPGKRQTTLAMAVGVRLPAPARTSTDKVEVIATAFDTEWRQRGTYRQVAELTLQPSTESNVRYEVLSRLPLAPGRYEIRIAAQDGERAGSVFTDVDVPDFTRERLSLSGLLMSATSAATKAVPSLLADLAPIVPSTVREFQRAADVTVFLRVYQGGSSRLGDVRLKANIVDDANRSRFEQTTPIESARFGSARAADYRLTLPLSTLEPGAHLLTIEATMDRATARRDARFTVR